MFINNDQVSAKGQINPAVIPQVKADAASLDEVLLQGASSIVVTPPPQIIPTPPGYINGHYVGDMSNENSLSFGFGILVEHHIALEEGGAGLTPTSYKSYLRRLIRNLSKVWPDITELAVKKFIKNTASSALFIPFNHKFDINNDNKVDFNDLEIYVNSKGDVEWGSPLPSKG